MLYDVGMYGISGFLPAGRLARLPANLRTERVLRMRDALLPVLVDVNIPIDLGF
ncbi:hypothetical protein ACQPZ2_22965 [Nocardia pseudovaccinii]|uniref:hypothetical protein n=1 Tax=Nocardia pseudovaccinii TaxID=189540 RepID=UPI003D8F9B43